MVIRGLVAGATYPVRALTILQRQSHLQPYLIKPILINFLIGVGLYLGLLLPGWHSVNVATVTMNEWLNSLITNLPTWLGALAYVIVALGWLLRGFLMVGLLLLIGFLLVQFGVILGAPWYGQLSEQVEQLRTGEVKIVEVGIVRDISRAILFELKKLVLMLAVGLPLLLLSFLPGTGTLISAIAGISLAATIVCLDFLDGPSERRRFSFRKKLRIVSVSLPASASFGLVCLGLVSIPFVNLLTIPLCVTAGTLFWCDRILPKLDQNL